MTKPTMAQHPGRFVEREIEKRGWSQADLADVIGRPIQMVNDIIAGKRGISPDTALRLGQAFGTAAEFWLNLDALYQLSLADDPGPEVGLRARVFSVGGVQEATRRGWIKQTPDAQELADDVCRFFKLKSIDDKPRFWDRAARKSTSYEEDSPAQTAWMFRALEMAEEETVPATFDQRRLPDLLNRLKPLLGDAQDVAQVPSILAQEGILFLAIEALPRTRIDGVCFWQNKKTPVIAMSLRYDRIDYFWHTLMHELAHVAAGDGLTNDHASLDVDLLGSHTPGRPGRPPAEVAADEFAVSTLIPQESLEAFIRQCKPLYSRRRILDLADSLGVHAGVVVGQLQYRGEILYSHSRDLLVSVRDLITGSARTDGWNKSKRSA